MAKSYQEKMYEDYKRTHPTWHRDINGYETRERATRINQNRERIRDYKEPVQKKGTSTYKPPTGRQPKYEYHVVERGTMDLNGAGAGRKQAVKSKSGSSVGNMTKESYGVGWVQDGKVRTWNGHGNKGTGSGNSTNKAQKRKKTNQLLNSLTRR